MKFNHLCLLGGILVILLAMTVFANAASVSLTCANPFSCGVTSYCTNVSGAVPGLLVSDGECGSGGSEPCTYTFSSSSTGTQNCTINVQTTGYGNKSGSSLQNNEKVSIAVNGTFVGTTSDKYANTSDPAGTVFCGTDTQTFNTTLTLAASNTLEIDAQDSMALSGVTINCSPSPSNPPVVDQCQNNIPPAIKTIPTQTIAYNSSFQVDLWNYVSDIGGSLGNTVLAFSQSGNSVTCSLDGHYLNCASATTLGNTTMTVSATDACGATTTASFTANVYNQPPVLSVPDTNVSCTQNLTHVFDLQNYVWDEQKPSTTYTLISQSNPSIVSCVIDGGHYFSCVLNTCAYQDSNLVVRATDVFGLTSTDSFLLKVRNSPPTWKTVPEPTCVNSATSDIIDFRGMATDFEDGNNLSYSITTQTNTNDIHCFIDNNQTLSCDSLGNKKITDQLTIRATDSNNGYADTNILIKTNCFGNDNNSIDSNFVIESQTAGICMASCTSYTTQIKVTNYTGAQKCFDFFEDHSPSDFALSIQNPNFCLNNNETTYLSLSANSCNADSTSYTVHVKDEDNNVDLPFSYKIGSCTSFDGFSITNFDGKVCRGEEIDLPVSVRNTTDTNTTISLIAENPFLLPFFNVSSVKLNANSEKEVRLHVNARTANLGNYTISLGGDATDYHIEKQLSVDVVDCTDIKRNFLLKTPQVCYDVSRGQIFEGSFTVQRLIGECTSPSCGNHSKGIELSLSGIDYQLSQSTVELKPLQEKSVDYQIKVPDTAPAGVMFVQVNGKETQDGIFDDTFATVDPVQLCLTIAGESHAGINLRTQAKDIEWCASQVFELEILNTGDFDENFALSTASVPSGVTVTFSENQIFVPRGSSKIVYVSIATSPSSLIADNQFVSVQLSGTTTLTTKIYFNIKEKPSFSDLEIVSATREITMPANSESTYSVLLKNNLERDLTNVTVSFENVPTDVNFETVIIPLIKKGETMAVTGKVLAGDTNGTFTPVLVAASGTVINKKQIYVVIEQNPNSGLTGLFSLGGGGLATLLAIFLILLVAVLIVGIVQANNSPNNEPWMDVE